MSDDKIGGDEMQVLRPKFEPEHLRAEREILQIEEVATDMYEGKKVRMLRFKGFADRWLRLNATQMIIVVKHLGDTPSKWVGKHVPVEVTDTKYNDQTFKKVYVVECDGPQWPAALTGLAWK